MKSLLHLGESPRLSHYHDSERREVDLVIERSGATQLVEAESGATYASDYARSAVEVKSLLSALDASADITCSVVYGGDMRSERSDATVVPWNEVESLITDREPRNRG